MTSVKFINFGGGKKNSSKFSLTLANKCTRTLVTSAILMGFSTLPSQAAITSYSINKWVQYSQTSNSQPITGQYFLTAGTNFNDSTDLTTVTTTYNGLLSPLNHTIFQSKQSQYNSPRYSSQVELDANFPDGTIYTFDISGGTLGTQTATLQTPATSLFPLSIPYLTGTTYSQLQGLDPSNSFVVNFNGFSPVAGVSNFTSFRIHPQSGGNIGFSAIVSPSETSALLPANTLAPNTNYGFNIQHGASTGVGRGFGGAFAGTQFSPYTLGSFTTGQININNGTTPTNPLLPTPTPGTPGFTFPGVTVGTGGLGIIRPIFFDPDLAVGYDYSVTGGPLFASVLIPNPLPRGDSNFTLELPGFGNFPLLAGTAFDLLSVNPLGFSNFRISGIDTDELLNPTNPTAFVTGLTFTNAGVVNVTQTPIIQNVPDPVSTPEPSSLVGIGLLGAGLVLTRRKRG